MANDKVAELVGLLSPDSPSEWVSNLWNKYHYQRAEKLSEWAEVDKYIFATDTTTTSNSSNPWTHNTTIPKLTQIRDNLHANYLSSLFPNDKWLTWMAYSRESAVKEKAKTITSYMENKTREGGFRDTVSSLLYDYIDKGVCFSIPTFEARYKQGQNGQKVASFIGPKLCRISPYDIVFNPLASSFQNTHKVVRSMATVGELKKLAATNPDHSFWTPALEQHELKQLASQTYSIDDWQKAEQYSVDGFGSLREYYQSNSVEILEFYGDYHDAETGELHLNRMITVVDRTIMVRNEEIPSYDGRDMIEMVGWRKRPDNLWAMGPLDNLVGMQYMLDHYLNMGANALDLKVMPPKKIIGDVEEFVWEPNGEIHIDENGDVQELAQQFGDVFAVKDMIQELEARMEMYAGAPREAMGIRTPGEKTAFEVQTLENASGRIFGEKIAQFEIFLEKNLNNMLEVSHRNMDYTDTIRVVDDDYGAVQFMEITKEDITADGILRPIGARHFAQKAQELQNLVGIFNSPLGQMIAPHTSSVAMSKFVEDVVDLRGYNMFQENIAIQEQQETASLAQQAEEDVAVAGQMSEEEAMMGAL
ncbi:MAG: hypothetical protein CMN30_31810 [Sandaracinus sp.]|nr:hypothetical protein [Sandaracinus sp.]